MRQVKNRKKAARLKPGGFRRWATEAAHPSEYTLAARGNKGATQFENPFTLADFEVFDNAALKEFFRKTCFGVSLRKVALALHGENSTLARKISRQMPLARRFRFWRELNRPASLPKIEAARRKLLDGFFWELTYWKTPELYEELTAGEKLHPGIFRDLAGWLRGKTVLDAGAGTGRASFESLRRGAALVYAVEPSPGLLHILETKLKDIPAGKCIKPLKGRFDSIPLPDKSVDLALSSSAFTADSEQGGEVGLKELLRVTKNGGKIVIIWPRPQDYGWLARHGFSYVSLPGSSKMKVVFPNKKVARRVARRFYGRNRKLRIYLNKHRHPKVPFSVLGFNPPHDYCWLTVHQKQ